MFLVVTFLFYKFEFGGIHKPCGHGGGRDGGFAKCPYYCISFIK